MHQSPAAPSRRSNNLSGTLTTAADRNPIISPQRSRRQRDRSIWKPGSHENLISDGDRRGRRATLTNHLLRPSSAAGVSPANLSLFDLPTLTSLFCGGRRLRLQAFPSASNHQSPLTNHQSPITLPQLPSGHFPHRTLHRIRHPRTLRILPLTGLGFLRL